jgi:pantoate kinase
MGIEHEKKRFQAMTPQHLETRLIRKPEKLAKFVAIALEFAERFPNKSERYFDLAKRAKAKLEGELYPGQQYQFNFAMECKSDKTSK